VVRGYSGGVILFFFCEKYQQLEVKPPGDAKERIPSKPCNITLKVEEGVGGVED
jgi:hypothetical protein